jgi:carbamoyltransferase
MYILGINAYHGDVSAVLLRDGELVTAIEEERFRRVKHWAGFPTQSIRACLEAEGIEGRDIAHVAVSRNTRAHLLRKVGFVLSSMPSPKLVTDRLKNARKVGDLRAELADALRLDVAQLPPIHGVEHHPAHLASAFFVSPMADAAVAAIDGFGDFVSTSLALGTANKLKVLERVYFPHSLGLMYTAITQYLGFHSYGDEFKVMGLAPYGEPKYVDQLRNLVRLEKNGLFKLNLRYFRHWRDGVEMEWREGYPTMGTVFSDELEKLLGPARKPGQDLTQREEDIARSLQALHEECVFHLLNHLWELTRNPRLCLAGGCAMNSVANGKIRANTPFKEVYIQPAAGDNGTALGAAYYVWHQKLDKPRNFVMEHAYWGPSYPKESIAESQVPASGTEWNYTRETYSDEDGLMDAVAELLADGNVVGWYQGAMEWGARALGNRSILADPRRADMRDLINTKIKFREKFRPFAPSILEEALDDYFVDAAPDPFMQQVYPVREERKAQLPAITHVDGTGRLQTVSERTNPRYYRLIKAFERRTGTPVLLNTSFNENEPIVDRVEQAFDCFLRTRMDAIVVNNTIVRRVAINADRETPAISATG